MTPTAIMTSMATEVVVVTATEAMRTATPILPTVVSQTPTAVSPTATAIVPTVTLSPPTATPTATMVSIPAATVEVADAILPAGFSMIRFAALFRPTSLTFDENGRLYAASTDGTIHAFIDEDGDGRADEDVVVSQGFNLPLGLAFHAETGDLYVSSNGRVSILRDFDGDLVADEVVNFVRDLPVGLHQNDNLTFGPDGWLYMGVGSTCDACEEVDERSGTIMRFDVTTGASEIYATGLRNPYDVAFHPVTGAMFATDNGRDDLGDDAPFEELNLIVQGGDYGWPGCWNEREGVDCEGTETAVAFFEAHSSANSLIFYSGKQFPTVYEQMVFVALWGTFLKEGVVTGIMGVTLREVGDGYENEMAWFAQWPGRPLGLTQGADGALYVGDFFNDVIYRISYGSE